jgi:hypothetical protein
MVAPFGVHINDGEPVLRNLVIDKYCMPILLRRDVLQALATAGEL